jgi:hypothetical protein
LGVGLTHSTAGATSFFSFTTFSFLGADEELALVTDFRAALASLSRRFASFFSGCQSQLHILPLKNMSTNEPVLISEHLLHPLLYHPLSLKHLCRRYRKIVQLLARLEAILWLRCYSRLT